MVIFMSENTKKAKYLILKVLGLCIFGGRRGIRTLDTESPYAAFPGRYNQPLCHPS